MSPVRICHWMKIHRAKYVICVTLIGYHGVKLYINAIHLLKDLMRSRQSIHFTFLYPYALKCAAIHFINCWNPEICLYKIMYLHEIYRFICGPHMWKKRVWIAELSISHSGLEMDPPGNKQTDGLVSWEWSFLTHPPQTPKINHW